MLRIVRSARRVAASSVSVMIQGATGTGKELFARALHAASGRAPFVALNCAAIPESLIESELFGYKSGAFTGARREGMKGTILQASGGTLFLDEIGDMPLALQTRLLRVLEEHEVVPLGADKPMKVDLRVVCASHQNLRSMIARGQFREDLYYRLNGITLELPRLAERTDKEQLIRKLLGAETSVLPGRWRSKRTRSNACWNTIGRGIFANCAMSSAPRWQFATVAWCVCATCRAKCGMVRRSRRSRGRCLAKPSMRKTPTSRRICRRSKWPSGKRWLPPFAIPTETWPARPPCCRSAAARCTAGAGDCESFTGVYSPGSPCQRGSREILRQAPDGM